jgi:hypothetical protein
VTPEAFTGEVQDLSTDQGFQFGFACARCGASWRTSFQRLGSLTLESVLDRADDVLGGIFGAARAAIDQVRGPAWERGREAALSAALLEAREHFACCARCAREVCGSCWDPRTDLCADCRLHPEAALPEIRSSEPELTPQPVQRCGHCGTPVSGGSFCPVCSYPL